MSAQVLGRLRETIVVVNQNLSRAPYGRGGSAVARVPPFPGISREETSSAISGFRQRTQWQSRSCGPERRPQNRVSRHTILFTPPEFILIL